MISKILAFFLLALSSVALATGGGGEPSIDFSGHITGGDDCYGAGDAYGVTREKCRFTAEEKDLPACAWVLETAFTDEEFNYIVHKWVHVTGRGIKNYPGMEKPTWIVRCESIVQKVHPPVTAP